MDYIEPTRDENLLNYLKRNLNDKEYKEIFDFLKNFIDKKYFIAIFGKTNSCSKNQIPFFGVDLLKNTVSQESVEYGINFVYCDPRSNLKRTNLDNLYNHMSSINHIIKPNSKNQVTFKTMPGVISVYFEKLTDLSIRPIDYKDKSDTIKVDVYVVLVFIPKQINRIKSIQEIEEAAGRGIHGQGVSREAKRRDMRDWLHGKKDELDY